MWDKVLTYFCDLQKIWEIRAAVLLMSEQILRPSESFYCPLATVSVVYCVILSRDSCTSEECRMI